MHINIYSHSFYTVIYNMPKEKKKPGSSKRDHIFSVGGTHIRLTTRVTSMGRSRLIFKFKIPSYEGYFLEKTNKIVVLNNFGRTKGENRRNNIPIARTTMVPYNNENLQNNATSFYAVVRGETPGIYHR